MHRNSKQKLDATTPFSEHTEFSFLLNYSLVQILPGSISSKGQQHQLLLGKTLGIIAEFSEVYSVQLALFLLRLNALFVFSNCEKSPLLPPKLSCGREVVTTRAARAAPPTGQKRNQIREGRKGFDVRKLLEF